MKKVLLYALIIIALITSVFIGFPGGIPKVQAAGSIILSIPAASYGSGSSWMFYASTHWAWSAFCTASSCDALSGGNPKIGWMTPSAPDNYIHPESSFIYFDISSLPAGSQINSVSLNFTIQQKANTSGIYNDFYWSFWKTDAGSDHIWNAADNRRWYACNQQGYGRQCAPQHYSAYAAGSTYIMPLLDKTKALYCYPGTTITAFQVMTENQFQAASPTQEDGKRIDFDISTCYLNINYTPPPNPRNESLSTNAALAGWSGMYGCDNVTLETLNCMYADEKLSFIANGFVGNNITMQLFDMNNQVIDTHQDMIRVDGRYVYQYQLPTSYSGFVRVQETYSTQWSSWVAIQPAPDFSEQTNLISAYSTVYPQYTVPFSSYVVYDGDLMYYHWKTNMVPADFPNYGLELLANGVTAVYQQRMSDLITNMGGTTANQNNLGHWRFAVFTPSVTQGMQTYGLVKTLSYEQSRSLYTGFIQPLIMSFPSYNTVLADTSSAYWYLSEPSKGISLSMSQTGYSNGDTPHINLTVGNECKVETMLNTGTVTSSILANTRFTAQLGGNDISLSQIANVTTDFTDTLKVKLSMPGLHTYVYEYDFTVKYNGSTSTTTTNTGQNPQGPLDTSGGLFSWIAQIIGLTHLNSTSGHWIALLIGCVLLFAAFRKYAALRVALPLLLIGCAAVMGWIDRWWAVVLAGGLGLMLFSAFRKKTSGGGQGEG